ncbi:hypothetical protein [Cedratvirus kamchatka]|uniref:Uncharacterized protein n=1 Tax=Cedratvirus kamchatka TaxID=2716914 RepID=A0A6G8MXW0_9VIRU|nr:hypothetical protein [Cedratvirus kamchatka]
MEHYGKLVAFDYKISIRLCSEEDYPSCDRKKKIPYFYGTTFPELDPDNQVLVSYEIIFTPACFKDKPHSSLWKEDIEAFRNQTYAHLVMKRYAYYPAFVLLYDPSSMKIGSCLDGENDSDLDEYDSDDRVYDSDDRYCNGKVRVYETGLWCCSCHDYFEENIDENLAYFIQSSVRMSEFPFESILEIRKKIEPLPKDFNPKKYMRKLEKKASKLAKIKQELQAWDEETQRLLSERDKKKQILLSCLD